MWPVRPLKKLMNFPTFQGHLCYLIQLLMSKLWFLARQKHAVDFFFFLPSAKDSTSQNRSLKGYPFRNISNVNIPIWNSSQPATNEENSQDLHLAATGSLHILLGHRKSLQKCHGKPSASKAGDNCEAMLAHHEVPPKAATLRTFRALTCSRNPLSTSFHQRSTHRACWKLPSKSLLLYHLYRIQKKLNPITPHTAHIRHPTWLDSANTSLQFHGCLSVPWRRPLHSHGLTTPRSSKT